MKIAILTIGDELLNGDLADTNTVTICRILSEYALTVHETVTVGDNEPDIILALQRLAANFSAVIVTGGLGPTEDDRTAKAAAKAFNRSLSLNDKALQQIRERFRIMQRDMHPANEKQAMLPGRSAVITNHNGTAPGFHLQHNAAELYFLPGVPNEMLAMLDENVLPSLRQRFPDLPQLCRRSVSVYGLAEPEVESRLKHAALPENVDLAFNVELPLVMVKLRASGNDAQKQVDRAELAARKALGDHVVGVDEETLAGKTAQYLTGAGLSLALAESCTGGLIAKLLTDHAGASAFLERSVVTYANSAKMNCLNVPEIMLERHGAVSAECASAMARGVRAVARTDIGLAVTGIAGPGGGTADKPVGTVYMAMISANGECREKFHFAGNREQIRMRTAFAALDWLRRLAMDNLNVTDQRG